MRTYLKIYYRCRWYWSDHKPLFFLTLILVLGIVFATIYAHSTHEQSQYQRDEILLLTDYINEQETNLHYLALKMDSIYTKQLMLEREVISLARIYYKGRK